jgi:hypothetical protein
LRFAALRMTTGLKISGAVIPRGVFTQPRSRAALQTASGRGGFAPESRRRGRRLQAALCDGAAFDPFSLQQDFLAAASSPKSAMPRSTDPAVLRSVRCTISTATAMAISSRVTAAATPRSENSHSRRGIGMAGLVCELAKGSVALSPSRSWRRPPAGG